MAMPPFLKKKLDKAGAKTDDSSADSAADSSADSADSVADSSADSADSASANPLMKWMKAKGKK